MLDNNNLSTRTRPTLLGVHSPTYLCFWSELSILVHSRTNPAAVFTQDPGLLVLQLPLIIAPTLSSAHTDLP